MTVPEPEPEPEPAPFVRAELQLPPMAELAGEGFMLVAKQYSHVDTIGPGQRERIEFESEYGLLEQGSLWHGREVLCRLLAAPSPLYASGFTNDCRGASLSYNHVCAQGREVRLDLYGLIAIRDCLGSQYSRQGKAVYSIGIRNPTRETVAIPEIVLLITAAPPRSRVVDEMDRRDSFGRRG